MNVLASEQRSLCSILSIKAVFSLTLVLETLKNMFLYVEKKIGPHDTIRVFEGHAASG